MSKGYKYLYLSEPDANLFKPGTDFHGEWLDVPGEGKRCASTQLGLEALVGGRWRAASSRSVRRVGERASKGRVRGSPRVVRLPRAHPPPTTTHRGSTRLL